MTRLPLLGAALALGAFATGCSTSMPAATPPGDAPTPAVPTAAAGEIPAPCENGTATLPPGAEDA